MVFKRKPHLKNFILQGKKNSGDSKLFTCMPPKYGLPRDCGRIFLKGGGGNADSSTCPTGNRQSA